MLNCATGLLYHPCPNIAMRSEHPELARPQQRCSDPRATASRLWVPACGWLQKKKRNRGEMGEMRSKKCEGVGSPWGREGGLRGGRRRGQGACSHRPGRRLRRRNCSPSSSTDCRGSNRRSTGSAARRHLHVVTTRRKHEEMIAWNLGKTQPRFQSTDTWSESFAAYRCSSSRLRGRGRCAAERSPRARGPRGRSR